MAGIRCLRLRFNATNITDTNKTAYTSASITVNPAGLAKLQLAEFIYEVPVFPESEYTFKHALTQEVAYNSVLIERRREVHERSAAAIEELFAGKLDDHVDTLAYHYSRSGNAPKAVGFLRLAAEQARTRSAYDDALRCINEALRLLAEIPESLERRLRLRE